MKMFEWKDTPPSKVSNLLEDFVGEKFSEGKKASLSVFYTTFRNPQKSVGPPGLKRADRLIDGSWFLHYSYDGDPDEPWDLHFAALVFAMDAEQKRGNSDMIYRFYEEDRKMVGGVPDYGELMLVRMNHKGFIVFNDTETHEYLSAGFPPQAIWRVLASEEVFTDEKVGTHGKTAPPEVLEEFLEECRKAREISGVEKRLVWIKAKVQ